MRAACRLLVDANIDPLANAGTLESGDVRTASTAHPACPVLAEAERALLLMRAYAAGVQLCHMG